MAIRLGAMIRALILTALCGLLLADDGKVLFKTPYKNFSGDWEAATYSPDGRYIVLGCPYNFDFAVLERTTSTP